MSNKIEEARNRITRKHAEKIATAKANGDYVKIAEGEERNVLYKASLREYTDVILINKERYDVIHVNKEAVYVVDREAVELKQESKYDDKAAGIKRMDEDTKRRFAHMRSQYVKGA